MQVLIGEPKYTTECSFDTIFKAQQLEQLRVEHKFYNFCSLLTVPSGKNHGQKRSKMDVDMLSLQLPSNASQASSDGQTETVTQRYLKQRQLANENGEDS